MKLFDLHCDTLLRCHLTQSGFQKNDGHVDLEKLQAGRALAQCFAVYTPTHEAAREVDLDLAPYEYYRLAVARFYKEMQMHADRIRPALTAAEVLANQEKGLISAILTMEDCVPWEGQIERVEESFRDGVRMAALTHNYENQLGCPHSPDPECMKKGLKPFGFACVERMNKLGMIVDVSHLSEGGFWDVAAHSKKPFIASHSCARALCRHSRNLKDDQIRKIGEKGGVIGVNFYSYFLRDGSGCSRIEEVLQHMDHIRQVAGIEALALGSDHDGILCELEWQDYAGMPFLWERMKERFHESEIESICSRNALRVFREVIGE